MAADDATPDVPFATSPTAPPGTAPTALQETAPIAPVWHTALVVFLLLAISGIEVWKGSISTPGEVSSRVRLANYATVLVWEWLTVAFIVWGIRRRGHRLADLIGGRWPTVGAFGRDLGIGVLFLIGSAFVLAAIRMALHDTPNQTVKNLLPDGPLEMAVWILLSATAGFCEETIFRGYLQKQFARLTKNANVGLVLQALVFGACHGYQGPKSALTITVYGFLFGVLANKVQSLRPGMLAHFLQDGVGGLAGRAALKHLPGG